MLASIVGPLNPIDSAARLSGGYRLEIILHEQISHKMSGTINRPIV